MWFASRRVVFGRGLLRRFSGGVDRCACRWFSAAHTTMEDDSGEGLYESQVRIDRSSLRQIMPAQPVLEGEDTTHFGTVANSLERELSQMMQLRGPIPMPEYMRVALGHPRYGYYMHQDVFGKQGDFTTAPEVSQLFGEMIGIWCYSLWIEMGKPRSCSLIELGPGRGTLMSDILRSTRKFSDFHSALSVTFVETSPHLRTMQKQKIEELGFDKVDWASSIADVEMKEGPDLVIGQEFLDALPVCQFQYSERGWCEKMVAPRNDGTTKSPFKVVLSSSPTLASKAFLKGHIETGDTPKIGDSIEVSPASMAVVEQVADRIATKGGAALFVDYGNDFAASESIRGIKNHKFVSVLEEPGKVDLSADVDFSALRRTVERSKQSGALQTSATITQGDFLQLMGIVQRAERLVDSTSCETEQDAIVAGYERLVDPEQMGSVYKAMAIAHRSIGTIPGFPGPTLP